MTVAWQAGVANGCGKRAWQADVLDCLVFNGLSVIFINKCVLMWVCHCELGRMTSEAIQKELSEWF